MAEHIYAEQVLSSKRYEDGLVESMVDPYGERREEIVRCRDCKNAFRLDEGWAIDFPGKFNCIRYSQWDYYDDEQGMWLVELDGFCAWGRKRES